MFLVAGCNPKLDDLVADVMGIVRGVLQRFGLKNEAAADLAGYATRQRFEESMKNGGNLARLALLPDDVKRQIWLDLAPLFGVTDPNEIEKRLADLEAERDRQAKESEALRERLAELEERVLRLLPPASPGQQQEQRLDADDRRRLRDRVGEQHDGDGGHEGRDDADRDRVQVPRQVLAVALRDPLVGALLSAGKER